MNKIDLILKEEELISLSNEELIAYEGGAFLPAFLAIGAGFAAGVAIYEAGKATGEFIYHLTHKQK